jgi:hypothetical protein
MERLFKLQELFGGGPLAAFIAILIVGIVALWWQLLKSQRAHIALAVQIIPLVEKLNTTVSNNAEVIENAADVFKTAIEVFRALNRSEKPPRANQSRRVHSDPGSEPPTGADE